MDQEFLERAEKDTRLEYLIAQSISLYISEGGEFTDFLTKRMHSIIDGLRDQFYELTTKPSDGDEELIPF